MGTARTVLFILGALLMCIPGMFTWTINRVSVVCLIIGFLILLAAMIMSRSLGPLSAVWLLVTSNLSFWCCYGFWLLRIKFFVTGSVSEEGSVANIAGISAFWFAFLLIFLIYEGIILLRAILSNRQRTLALVVLAAVLAQVPLTLKFIWDALQGA